MGILADKISSLTNSHVQGQDLHNGLRGQKPERANQGCADDLARTLVLSLALGLVILIFRLFAKLLRFAAQDRWTVGLRQEEKPSDLNEPGGDRSCIEDPSPCSIFCNKTTGNRSDRRA
jgi:hypothetical protein